MSDYSLSGLSSRSFEHLIQALASRVLGPGLVVFGDGADGAREATFEGSVPYPSEMDCWQGYIVVQAKFKQRSEGTRKDGQWLLGQLEGELKKFASVKRALRKPQYYLLCTNVVLTPADRTGSKDRTAALLEKYRARLRLKGFDIWDYDKLRTLLDSNPEIRRTYQAWITPGDVLAALVAQLEVEHPSFEQDIAGILQKELLADQYVNLDQAGHSAEELVQTARVFVDLVATVQPATEPDSDDAFGEDDRLPPGFVREVLEAGDLPVGQPVARRGNSLDPREDATTDAKGRFVLIGGPGQGKSTVAQFICQLYRLCILRSRKVRLAAEARRVIDQIQEQCEREGIVLPVAPRFPVRVILNDFAKELASSGRGQLTLFTYILNRFRSRATVTLSADDLRQWLGAYPWFLVLDGLDEVPKSSNRDAVLQAVQDFCIDAAVIGSDLLILATTRPQGYNRDFSAEFYRHLYLAPLSPDRALYYGKRLAGARYEHDVDRRDRVTERLRAAAGAEATARLMTSPLQVTIMTTLVDRAGQPPPERWRLFSAYYDVIYRREAEREIATAAILRDNKANIDAIHQHVGLELQTQSERTGSTTARMSRERFSTIVRSRLSEEDYEAAALEELSGRITDAATQRLVFLVGAEADQIGFEIRSLQEFMAAEALMNGSDSDVSERLAAIAPISYWRNVFLLAAGKCFADRQHLRDAVTSVCENLNEGEPLERLTLAGSEVALDLLIDGTARQHPKYQRRLARAALRLAERPMDFAHDSLAHAYHDGLDEVYRSELSKYLPPTAAAEHTGALKVAMLLAEKGVAWAREAADQNWCDDATICAHLLISCDCSGPWLREKLERTLLGAPPMLAERLAWVATRDGNYSPWVGLLSPRPADLSVSFRLAERADSPLTFHLFSTRCEQFAAGLKLPNRSDHWEILRRAAAFVRDPSRTTLADAIQPDVVASLPRSTLRLPWPIDSCLQLARAHGPDIAARAAAGDFGGPEDWTMAEVRWESEGVCAEDLRAFDLHGATVGPYLRETGFPLYTAASMTPGHAATPAVTASLLELWAAASTEAASAGLASLALFAVRCVANDGQQTDGDSSWALKLARDASRSRWVDLYALFELAGDCPQDGDWIRVLNEIGELEHLQWWSGGNDGGNRSLTTAEIIRKAFARDPRQRGLGRLIATFLAAGDSVLSEVPVPEALDWPDSPFREALLQLRLTGRQLSPAAAERLAREVAELAHTSMDFVEVCTAIAVRSIPGKALERFLITLYESLLVCEWNGRRAVLSNLGELRRSARSPLEDPSVWHRLGLPEVERD